MPAFARALELGADGVELDVHRTADDGWSSATTPRRPPGRSASSPPSRSRAALPEVPTLAEALDACAGTLVNVEIKNLPQQPGFDPDDRCSDLVVALLRGAGRPTTVLVSSFDLAPSTGCAPPAPEVADRLSSSFGGDPLDALDWAAERGHAARPPRRVDACSTARRSPRSSRGRTSAGCG